MQGRIITIAQQKGGSGKTTLSAQLAGVWSKTRKNAKVAILDVDPQGSLGEWFEAREQALGEDETGLTFRTASGWGARREARALSRDHDLVVVDTPPKSDSDARPAIEAGHMVAVPVQPSPVDLWATRSTLQLAEKEERAAILVLNRVPPRAALTGEMLEAMAAFDNKISKTRLGNRVAFAASMGQGLTVLETAPASKATAEMTNLAKELHRALARTGDI
ncbi:MAG: ParA family partition ATPase [Pseudomonadota bacterium]